MGKRTGQRVRAKVKDLSSGPDRTTKVKGGGVAPRGSTQVPESKPAAITDGTSNTIMLGGVVRARRP